MEGESETPPGPSRGRGRGKSRGGYGKYLRARGRGHGRGRPAEFSRRLVLEDEQDVELDEDEAKEMARKYSRRQLGSNADRYVEPEPELDSDGEPIVEPEVDLTSFLEKQRQAGDTNILSPAEEADDDDIDHSLAQLSFGKANSDANNKKGKAQSTVWDESLEELSREKAAADAARDLKTRFREKTERQRSRGTAGENNARRSRPDNKIAEAPALPTDVSLPPKSEREKMEEFLDDLLG